MRRHLLGIVTLFMLFIGGVGFYQAWTNTGESSMLANTCWKAGLVLGALWLALPQLNQLMKRFPPWMLAAAAVAGLVLIVNPKTIAIIGPIFLVIVALKYVRRFLTTSGPPRRRRTPVKRSDERRE